MTAARQPADVVGHKTIRRDDGSLYHDPLTRAEADEMHREWEQQEARRRELMPDEQSAISMLFHAYRRLFNFGWREAIYCPKDGSAFVVIEPGSTGIHRCVYEGDWPKGSWRIISDGDMSPSRPCLFRPESQSPAGGTT